MESKRKAIDWGAVERDYRAGTFSNRELAHKHGCAEGAIRYRAKQHGWQKDLTEEVRKATNAKLLRSDLRTPNARDDSAIIDQVADFRAAVVTSHRKDLLQLHALKRIILDRLAAHLHGETPEGPFMGEKESPGDLVEKLSRVTSRLIPLERQAHNLDEAPTPGASVTVAQAVTNMTAERYETIARKVSDEF